MIKDNTYYINKRDRQIARSKKQVLFVQVCVLLFGSFVLGFYTCAQIYYEMPLDEIVIYEGYNGRPLYGHYVEFLDSFMTKEEYNAKSR